MRGILAAMNGIKFNLLYDLQKCPVCKKKCITLRKKGSLSNFFYDNRCPNCKSELKLCGKIYKIGGIINCLIIMYALIIYSLNLVYFKFFYFSLLFLVICDLLFQNLIVLPLSTIAKYDSTPMDDLINNYQKFKSFVKERVGKIGKKDK